MPRQLPLLVALGVLGYAFWASPTLTEIAAGIAVFLFGMMALEQGFKAFTGGSLEALLRHSTNRLWKSLAFGALATTLTQSSSLVSVITISFLSAGLLGLSQGIGIIFGANLGTTTGAWLVAGLGLNVNIGAYALPMLTFGIILIFNKSRSLKGLGHVLTGIGFLFLGIHFMKEGFENFQHSIDLSQFAMTGLSGLFAYTALGILATVIMQSSHATLVLTITALAAGQLSYENALALSIGANVGTTITALIGAVGANIEGRRLAGAHLVFNLVTGIIALSAIQFFMLAVDAASAWLGIDPDNHALKLALFHTLFNLTGIIVMVPLIPHLVRGLETWMKPRPVIPSAPAHINDNMLEMPAAALEATRLELLRLYRRVFNMIALVLHYEPAQLRRGMSDEDLGRPPERVHAVDVEALYLDRIKPLHGQILDYLSRVSVSGHRTRQLVMLRVASRDLIEAVKDIKHLQKNMVGYLRTGNEHVREEYLAMRANLGWLLQELEQAAPEAGEALGLRLSEMATMVEARDIVGNGKLDQLIRSRRISPEQATSLMNDNAYVYRISKKLLALAGVIFAPFEQEEEALAETMVLDRSEVEELLSQSESNDQSPG